MRKHPGINQRTGRLKKGWKWGANGRPVKAGGGTASRKKKITKRKSSKRGLMSKVKSKVRTLGRKLGG